MSTHSAQCLRECRVAGRRSDVGGAASAREHDHQSRGERHDCGSRGVRRSGERPVARCGVALVSRSRCAERGDVRTARTALHVSKSWNSRVRQRVLRHGWNGGGCPLPGGRHRIGRRDRQNSAPGRNPDVGAGPRSGESLCGTGDFDGGQRNRYFRRRFPGRLGTRYTGAVVARSPGGCQPRRGSSVALLARREARGLYVPPKPSCASAGRQRLASLDARRSTHGHSDSR